MIESSSNAVQEELMTKKTPSSDIEDIRALLDTVNRAHHDKDAGAVVAQFDPDAVIFDLAPPLSHKLDQQGWVDWFDTWDGPVEQKSQDLNFTVMGDLAVVHGLYHVNATPKEGGDPAVWWMRATVALRKVGDSWKIIHEHTSVPYHMDGSFRAATDLDPERIRLQI
jgi:ketosteroid isomerase-like protein